MTCPTCQHRNSATANFCEHCGATLTMANPATVAPPSAAPTGAPPPPDETQETQMSATTLAPATAADPGRHSPTPPRQADPSPPPFAWPAAQSGPGMPSGANWVDLRRGPVGAPGASVAPPASAPAPSTSHPDEESRRWAMGAHVSAIAGGFLGGVPAFLGPLIVWLLRKDRDGFAAGHGRAALNFNLSMLTYAGALLVFTLVTFGLGAVLTAPVGVGLGIVWLTFSIIGAVRAANDEPFRYPITIPFVR